MVPRLLHNTIDPVLFFYTCFSSRLQIVRISQTNKKHSKRLYTDMDKSKWIKFNVGGKLNMYKYV